MGRMDGRGVVESRVGWMAWTARCMMKEIGELCGDGLFCVWRDLGRHIYIYIRGYRVGSSFLVTAVARARGGTV